MASGTEIVYGIHTTRLVLQKTPESVLDLWVQVNKRDSRQIKQLLAMAAAIPVQFVSREALDRLAQNGRHQGIAIRKKKIGKPVPDIAEIIRNTRDTLPLFLVLDGVQDPHNLGACLRTADAAGVQAVILPRNQAAGITPVVSKVASGAAEHVPVVQVTNLARTLAQLQEAGIWVIGTADSAETCIYAADFNRPLALVMGSEHKGLRQNTRNHCDLLVYIPMAGLVESLNVSVAAGICLYEVNRQRTCSG